MPSFSHAFSLSVLEAMAYKIPCIGVKGEAMAEAIEGCGYCIEKGNVEELADRLCDLLTNRAQSAAWGEEARKRILANYSWDVVSRRIIDGIARVLEETSSRSETR